MSYRVLIVDDEAPAREKIALFLRQSPHSFDISTAQNAEQTMEVLNQSSFDILFLDIQMPRMNAFEMLQQIGLSSCPPIIFSTAYDQYALRAFEVHAIDYLLKPYDFDRFQTALERVLKLIDQQKEPHQMLEKLIQSWRPPSVQAEILWVSQGTKLIPLEITNIEYLESDGNYVLIHTPNHKYTLKQSLKDLQAKLDQRQFIRVHRSYVVNQLSIREMHPKSHGDLFAVLKSGRKIPVSRRYRDQLFG